MDAQVTVFPGETTVETAWARIGELRGRRITDVVLVDDQRKFAGVVRLQEIAAAEPEDRLDSLQDLRAVHVHPMASREEVVDVLNQHRLASLTVVDLDGRVMGVIRHDALVVAAQDSAAADMQQMVGASGEERALSSPWFGIRSRLPWLNVNLLTAFIASAVVGLFEGTLARFTAVAILLPVVAGQSGNTGAQALAVTMRGLALREIRVSHAFRVLRKELLLGLVNGLSIGVVTSLGVFLWSGNRGLALVMFAAMVVSMAAASVAGGAIPIVLVRLGRDPATASSILLTTITDVVGFSTFLGLATGLAQFLAE
jgi:magnesium transporter